MRYRRMLLARFLAVVLAATMAAVTAVPAFAAMDATLSSDHARPGDKLLLLTADHNGTWNYESLASENQQSIYLASVTASPRKHAVDRAVQSLDASSGEATQEASGSLYPAFPLASIGCSWRLSGSAGVLRSRREGRTT